MAKIAGVGVGACVIIFFILGGYNWWMSKKIGLYKVRLEQLNTKKDKTMALVEASRSLQVAPDIQGVADIFAHYPEWSTVLRTISRSITPQVWLTSISSEFYSEGSLLRRIEIAGDARSTASIARFVEILNGSELFSNVVLSKSSREGADNKQIYNFVVLGDVKFGEKLWK